MTNQLSSDAQAVLDAANKELDEAPWDVSYLAGVSAAAALRAAADLVAPDNYHCFTGHFDWDLGMESRNDTVRENLLAIAAELESC